MNNKANQNIFLVTIVLATFVVTTFVKSVVAKENSREGEIGWITAVVTSEEVYAADPNENKETIKKRIHLPVPREKYISRPFPSPKKDIVVTQSENRTVSYKLAKNAEKITRSGGRRKMQNVKLWKSLDMHKTIKGCR